MIVDKKQPYKPCASCGENFNMAEYMNSSYDIVYYSCIECRRLKNSIAAKKYRDKKKQNKVNQDAPHRPQSIQIRKVLNYLYDYEDLACCCGLCKKEPKYYNEIYPYDKGELYESIQIWLNESTRYNWDHLIQLYLDTFHLCDKHVIYADAGSLHLDAMMIYRTVVPVIPMPTIERLYAMDIYLER